MQKILFFLLINFCTSSFLQAAEFEVDPQTRAKISLKGAVAKDFVEVSDDSRDNKPYKSLSAGGALSLEYPLVPWLALGVEGRALFELDKNGPTYYDINGLLKFQFDLTESALASNLYFSIPGGLSLMSWKNAFSKMGLGFNTGLLLGSHFYFAERFGFFSEVGYIYRKITASWALNETEVKYGFHEIAANLGFSIGF